MRSGISLLEVLISIGVLSVGLLSIMMIIPLGQLTIAESVKADRAAACGRSVLRQIKVKRLLDYRSWWWGYIDPVKGTIQRENWGWGWYDCYDAANDPTHYTRKILPIIDPFTPFTDPDAVNKAGSITLPKIADAINCFIIDPVGIGRKMPDLFWLDNNYRSGNSQSLTNLSVPPIPFPLPTDPHYPAILPRRTLSASYLNIAGVDNNRLPIDGSAFIWPDDVSFDLPENPVERPTINQSVGLDNNRSWDYTYLLSVTPSGTEQVMQYAPDQTMNIPYRRLFDVTVVVFFQRNFNLTADGYPEGEWSADANFLGMANGQISPGGGTIQLRPDTAFRVKGSSTSGMQTKMILASETPAMRPNQCVMLWDWANGRSAWYRVVGINFEDPANATLTLDGPDWIVSATTKLLVIDGAIGAYTSTVELDSDPLWQGSD